MFFLAPITPLIKPVLAPISPALAPTIPPMSFLGLISGIGILLIRFFFALTSPPSRPVFAPMIPALAPTIPPMSLAELRSGRGKFLMRFFLEFTMPPKMFFLVLKIPPKRPFLAPTIPLTAPNIPAKGLLFCCIIIPHPPWPCEDLPDLALEPPLLPKRLPKNGLAEATATQRAKTKATRILYSPQLPISAAGDLCLSRRSFLRHLQSQSPH